MLMKRKNTGLFDLAATLITVTSRVEKHGPLDAEIVPGVEAAWYIAVVQPGQEGVAAGHLIGRRFGIYQPRYPDTKIERGRKVTRWRKIIPGYLFIFVWDIERHERRIIAIPGVQRLLRPHGSDLPIKVRDAEIDRLRAQENIDNPIRYTVETMKVRKRRKKRTMERHETVVQCDPDEIVAVTSKSYWHKAADGEHVSLLEKALGLPQGRLTESANRVTG